MYVFLSDWLLKQQPQQYAVFDFLSGCCVRQQRSSEVCVCVVMALIKLVMVLIKFVMHVLSITTDLMYVVCVCMCACVCAYVHVNIH